MANTEIERYPSLATKAPSIPDFGHWLKKIVVKEPRRAWVLFVCFVGTRMENNKNVFQQKIRILFLEYVF